jgi:signal peptidase II
VQGSRRVPLDLAHPGWVFIITAAAIVICDQIAKAVARASLNPTQPIVLLPGALRLILVHNAGAAFGLFPGGRPVFVFTSLLVLATIGIYWYRARPKEWPVVVALAMIAGGSLGNLIDRALVGQVTDFFEFMFVEFPVFNVADMGIVGGVSLLMVWILFGPQPSGSTADATGEATAEAVPEAPGDSNAENAETDRGTSGP